MLGLFDPKQTHLILESERLLERGFYYNITRCDGAYKAMTIPLLLAPTYKLTIPLPSLDLGFIAWDTLVLYAIDTLYSYQLHCPVFYTAQRPIAKSLDSFICK
jgi:hypothetical protein